MDRYGSGTRRTLTALVVVCGILTACTGDRGVAPPSAVRRLPSRPLAALAPAGAATPGALLGEVAFTIPDTGAASGILTLTTLGSASGPVLVDLVGPIQISNGTIPLTGALNPGAVMWFHSNGDLYVRYLTFGLFSVSSSGRRSYMSSPDLAPGDSVAVVDDSAMFHGITVIWETAAEEWSGLNASDPGFTHACPIMVSFTCIVPPPFVPANVSDVGPHGTIHVRAYAAEINTQARVTLSCPASVERGSDATCTVGADPSSALLTVGGWRFAPDTGTAIERMDTPAATTWSGPMVASGTVTVQATVNGVPDSASARIAATARDWSGQTIGLDFLEDSPGRLLVHPPAVGELGSTLLDYRLDASTLGAALAVVNNGPNTGFQYFTAIPFRARVVVSINTVALSVGSDFYLLQAPSRRTVGATVYCGRSDVVSIYLPGVRRHEGAGGRADVNSHVAIFTGRLEREARERLEGLVSQEGFPGIHDLLEAMYKAASDDSQQMHVDGRNPFVAPCVMRYF